MTVRKGSDWYDMPRAPGVPARWVATAYYRTADGLIDIDYAIEELDMLQDIIERGPDFHTLDRIEIRHARNPTPDLTIEQSKYL